MARRKSKKVVCSNKLVQCFEALQGLPPAERCLPPCAQYCTDWLLKGNCHSFSCRYLHTSLTNSDEGTKEKMFRFGIVGDPFKLACNEVPLGPRT